MSNQQIIIIGSPRSGTTYLLKLLASNTRFTWVSKELDLNPSDYHLSSKQKIYDRFYFGKKKYLNSQKNNTPIPVEPWSFWNHHFDYFQWNPKMFEVAKNALPEDNSPESIKNIQNAVSQIHSHSGKDYFLSKYTDFPRIQLLKKAFPKAKFIHLVRDGRAVAASYLKKMESGDFNTSKEETNWVSGWPKDWQDKYYNKYRNPSAFTLFQWQFFLKEIIEELSAIPNEDFIEVEYRDLIRDTPGTIQKILDFAKVEMDANMKYFLKNKPGQNQNFKWKKNLTSEQVAMFEDIIDSQFLKYLDV